MFPLSGADVPANVAAIATAMEEGLRRLCRPNGNPPQVRAVGDHGTDLGRLEILLDGSDFDPPAPPRPSADRRPGPRVGAFLLAGKGVRVRGSPLDVRIEAADVDFEVAAADDHVLLVPAAARTGEAVLRVPRESLETALREGIRAAAARQKVKVEDVSLELAEEEDGVRVRLLVTVKMLFAAKVRVSARLAPTPGPGLRIAEVSCRGEGMSGAAVAKMARRSVEGLEGREFSLADVIPPGLSPRKVELAVDDGLRVHAVLGGE